MRKLLPCLIIGCLTVLAIPGILYARMNLGITSYDQYGCNLSEGSRWCATMQKCIQPWITGCPQDSSANLLPEERYDRHGCDTAKGYRWCTHTGQCYLPWEKECTAAAIYSGRNDYPLPFARSKRHRLKR